MLNSSFKKIIWCLNNPLNYIFLAFRKLNTIIEKKCSEASCLWTGECCSHNRSFFMWLSAIFPSLHHGPKNPKTNVTTTQACGSPLCTMLSHPNGSSEAMWNVMSWGNFHLQSSLWTCEINTSSDRDEQLVILSERCPLQATVILWRSHWVSMLLRLQGQNWLTKRGSFHKHWSDNVMWHACVTIRVL